MISDIRVGLRLLWRDKAFTLTAALTLALCIGANTALFSVVHNVLLRPLPVPESDRIVLMGNAYPGAGAGAAAGSSSGVPDYYDRLRETDVFEEQALHNSTNQSVDQNGTPLRVRVTRATPSFFKLLRVAPALGRTFVDADGEVGNDKKVVLSYALWQSQFGGDPGAVGKDMRIDGQPFTVIGIMPKGFYFLNPNVMLWRPLAFTPQQKSDEQRHSNNFQNIARLKPGARIEVARQQIDALNARNLEKFPALKPLLINAGFHTTVDLLQDTLVRDIKATLYLMWGGALFVLLIGCVNVANLVLVRSRVRLKELATRLALGAGKWRVARQLVTESVILTMIAAAAGLAVGYGALRLLGTINIQDLPRGEEIRLDGVVVAYTLAVSAIIGFVLGLIPVANVLPANLTVVLREEGRSGTAGRGARALRRTLVVAQVAFAFVLLVGAGLLFASFRRILAVQPGFNPDGVLTASISLPRARYANDQALIGFTHEALQRIRALPGVTAVGATDTIPFGGNNSDSVILAEGYQMKPGESVISPSAVDVTPGYFEAIGAKLVRGRYFDERDGAAALKIAAIGGRPTAPGSIIVDETLAKRFWAGQDPIGRRMYKPNDIKDSDRDHPADRVLHRRRRHLRHQAARSHRGQQVGGRVLLSDGPGHVDGHDVRDQDRRRSAVADERGARRPQRARSRASRVRHANAGRPPREVAQQPQVAGPALAQLRRGGAVPVGDRHLRRARLSRHAAAAGDRHPDRARQQRARDLRAGPARRAAADCRRLRARRDRRDRPAAKPGEPAVRRQQHRSARPRGRHGDPRGGRARGVRAAGAAGDANRSDRRTDGVRRVLM